MKTWFRHHFRAIEGAIGHLRKSPLSSLMNVLVVAIALALPFAGLTILENVRPMSQQLSVDPEISLFMETTLAREKAEALSPAIQDILRVSHQRAKIIFVPRESALDMLKEKGSLSDVLTTLGANPLPDGYVLKLDSFHDAADASRIDALAEALKQLPGVETVQVDSAWVKRLAALLSVLRLSLLFLAATLGTVVIAVAFNTIRLQVMSQLDEIEVSRLIGATDAFIRRPFYYSGTLLGLGAGMLALGAVALALIPLNTAIAQFAHLYGSEFQLAALDIRSTAILLATSAMLGWAGAVLSVKRHLSRLA